MKKLLTLLFVIVSFQSIFAQKVTYGVKGGTNFSSYIENHEGPFNYKYKLGFQLGGFAKIALADKLFLQPELLYSMQGARFDLGTLLLSEIGPGYIDPLFSDGNMEGSYNESTIILPVMLKYYLNDKINIEIGPQMDYLFNIKTNLDEYTNIEGAQLKQVIT